MVWMTIDLMRVVVVGPNKAAHRMQPQEVVSVATILAPQNLASRFNDSMAAVDRGEADPIQPYEIVEGFVEASYPDGWMAVDHEFYGSCLEAVTAAGVVQECNFFYEDSE